MQYDEIIQKKYKILEQIGKGTFSHVYKGISLKTGEFIAIKVETYLSEDAKIGILKRETSILNYLGKDCLNIPKIHWFGKVRDSACLVIPFYDYSLYQWMQKTPLEERLPKVKNIRTAMIQILKQIHQMGVIHRDVKPHNFMVSKDNLYIIDFGLAAFYLDGKGNHIPDIVSTSTTILGTPNYASLFIHAGHTPSRRDDLISLEYVCMALRGELRGKDIVEFKKETLQKSEPTSSLYSAYQIGFKETPIYE